MAEDKDNSIKSKIKTGITNYGKNMVVDFFKGSPFEKMISNKFAPTQKRRGHVVGDSFTATSELSDFSKSIEKFSKSVDKFSKSIEDNNDNKSTQETQNPILESIKKSIKHSASGIKNLFNPSNEFDNNNSQSIISPIENSKEEPISKENENIYSKNDNTDNARTDDILENTNPETINEPKEKANVKDSKALLEALEALKEFNKESNIANDNIALIDNSLSALDETVLNIIGEEDLFGVKGLISSIQNLQTSHEELNDILTTSTESEVSFGKAMITSNESSLSSIQKSIPQIISSNSAIIASNGAKAVSGAASGSMALPFPANIAALAASMASLLPIVGSIATSAMSAGSNSVNSSITKILGLGVGTAIGAAAEKSIQENVKNSVDSAVKEIDNTQSINSVKKESKLGSVNIPKKAKTAKAKSRFEKSEEAIDGELIEAKSTSSNELLRKNKKEKTNILEPEHIVKKSTKKAPQKIKNDEIIKLEDNYNASPKEENNSTKIKNNFSETKINPISSAVSIKAIKPKADKIPIINKELYNTTNNQLNENKLLTNSNTTETIKNISNAKAINTPKQNEKNIEKQFKLTPSASPSKEIAKSTLETSSTKQNNSKIKNEITNYGKSAASDFFKGSPFEKMIDNTPASKRKGHVVNDSLKNKSSNSEFSESIEKFSKAVDKFSEFIDGNKSNSSKKDLNAIQNKIIKNISTSTNNSNQTIENQEDLSKIKPQTVTNEISKVPIQSASTPKHHVKNVKNSSPIKVEITNFNEQEKLLNFGGLNDNIMSKLNEISATIKNKENEKLSPITDKIQNTDGIVPKNNKEVKQITNSISKNIPGMIPKNIRESATKLSNITNNEDPIKIAKIQKTAMDIEGQSIIKLNELKSKYLDNEKLRAVENQKLIEIRENLNAKSMKSFIENNSKRMFLNLKEGWQSRKLNSQYEFLHKLDMNRKKASIAMSTFKANNTIINNNKEMASNMAMFMQEKAFALKNILLKGAQAAAGAVKGAMAWPFPINIAALAGGAAAVIGGIVLAKKMLSGGGDSKPSSANGTNASGEKPSEQNSGKLSDITPEKLKKASENASDNYKSTVDGVIVVQRFDKMIQLLESINDNIKKINNSGSLPQINIQNSGGGKEPPKNSTNFNDAFSPFRYAPNRTR